LSPPAGHSPVLPPRWRRRQTRPTLASGCSSRARNQSATRPRSSIGSCARRWRAGRSGADFRRARRVTLSRPAARLRGRLRPRIAISSINPDRQQTIQRAIPTRYEESCGPKRQAASGTGTLSSLFWRFGRENYGQFAYGGGPADDCERSCSCRR